MEFGSWSSGLTLVALESRASLAVHVSTRATIWMDFNFNSWFFHHFRGCNSNMYFSQESFWWNLWIYHSNKWRSHWWMHHPQRDGCIILKAGMNRDSALHCQDFVENQLYTAMKEADSTSFLGSGCGDVERWNVWWIPSLGTSPYM